MRSAFYITVDDGYLGIGRAQAKRLRAIWQIDVHLFIEGQGGVYRDETGTDGIYQHHNLMQGVIPDNLPVTEGWPQIVYARMFAPFLLRDYDRVIYLDADVYPLAAAPEIFSVELPYGFGAVQDAATMGTSPRAVKTGRDEWRKSIGLRSERYFNSGVLVIDPERWCKNDFPAALREFLAQFGSNVRMPDQDFLNWHFQGRWTEISPRFNYQYSFFNFGYDRIFPPVFIHFSSSRKPWRRPDRFESAQGQFFPLFGQMFRDVGVDPQTYMEKRPEPVIRRLRTALRLKLSQLGLVTSKERKQRAEWEKRARAIFEWLRNDAARDAYGDMSFTLPTRPEPRLSFDGRYLCRRLDIDIDGFPKGGHEGNAPTN